MQKAIKNSDQKIDELEASMFANGNTIDCPLIHRFTPGMYSREIFMPAGSMVTSMIHKTKHQFVVLEGVASVFSDNDGEQLIEAGHVGTTYPNTRRVLYIHEDCRWITFHPTNILPENETKEAIEKAVSLIEAQIIKPHINELLGGQLKNNVLVEKKLVTN